jgi:hypothetical protein
MEESKAGGSAGRLIPPVFKRKGRQIVSMLRRVWKPGAADSYSLSVRDQLQDIANPLLQEFQSVDNIQNVFLLCLFVV